MKFGVDKYTVMYLKKGVIVEFGVIELSNLTNLVSATENRKYLYFSQSLRIPIVIYYNQEYLRLPFSL